VAVAVALGFNPRSTHARLQPLTQVIVVDPTGASTTISKLGSDVCALAMAQPNPIAVNTITARRMSRAIVSS
jgi:hypothetical protein